MNLNSGALAHQENRETSEGRFAVGGGIGRCTCVLLTAEVRAGDERTEDMDQGVGLLKPFES